METEARGYTEKEWREIIAHNESLLSGKHVDPYVEPATELFQALENLYGDLYLLGMNENTLQDIYEGSFRDALKMLCKYQKFRKDD